MSTELDIEVRALLQAHRGDWQRIAAKADISHSWISQFMRGLIPNPGFQTLKRLHQHLLTLGVAPHQASATDQRTAQHPGTVSGS